jgi:hypothetical protein
LSPRPSNIRHPGVPAFVIPANAPYFRHPDERRGPDFEQAS